VILHLLAMATWDGVRDRPSYAPESLAAEGFVHCTGDRDTLLAVANAFYRDAPGAHVALEIDQDALASEVRWEPPAHPDGRPAADGEPLFPHVYGPLEPAAVVAVVPLVRAQDGTFTGYGEPLTAS
jgi:uncharacterized protein (DUF952 family)